MKLPLTPLERDQAALHASCKQIVHTISGRATAIKEWISAVSEERWEDAGIGHIDRHRPAKIQKIISQKQDRLERYEDIIRVARIVTAVHGDLSKLTDEQLNTVGTLQGKLESLFPAHSDDPLVNEAKEALGLLTLTHHHDSLGHSIYTPHHIGGNYLAQEIAKREEEAKAKTEGRPVRAQSGWRQQVQGRRFEAETSPNGPVRS